MQARALRTCADRSKVLSRFWITALVVAPLFFGPNLLLLVFGDAPRVALAVAVGNMLACACTAISFLLRARTEPESRTSCCFASLAAFTLGTGLLEQVFAALTGEPRSGYPSAGDVISILALPAGGLALVCMPIRPNSATKGANLIVDSLLFAASTLFIVFTLAYSRNLRLEHGFASFRDGMMLEIGLVILNLSILLYLVRVDPSCLRGPLGFITAALFFAAIPALLAMRVFMPAVVVGAPHPIYLFYSASNFALCMAAIWPGASCPRLTPGPGLKILSLSLSCLAYAPFALTVFLGFLVISGNRPLMWSGFACFFLILSRLVLALVDSHGLSHVLRERVRERTEQLQESQTRLARADRLDALGRLAGGVAHDFNNLLTAVVGNAQLLADSLPGGDRRRRYVAEITKTCERAEALTRQLLTFARKQPRSPRIFSPATLISDMQDLLRHTINENIRLTVNMEAGSDNVKMDPYQLEQVIMNLAVNARDAMPDGGSLRIEVANNEVNAAHVARHPQARPGPHVCLRISDSGSGIPREMLDRIFDPFFTTCSFRDFVYAMPPG
jgi:signal transduction histidine kinase